MTATVVGTVSDLRRYPVKSMLGEQLERAGLTEQGLEGDRAYALVDDETGKLVSVKRPNRWGRMFELRATTDGDAVRVSFPGGDAFGIDDPGLPERLSTLFGRSVSVAKASLQERSYEEAWVGDLKGGASPYLGMETTIIDGEEFIDAGAIMPTDQNFFDFGKVHLVTTASTKQLAEHAPESRFDPHRFRPNIVIAWPETGFIENEWQGRTLTIGGVHLRIGIPVPRCVMTTLAQDDLPADRSVLRTISRHNGIDVLGTGTLYPCVGVYADVDTPGEIAVGDQATID